MLKELLNICHSNRALGLFPWWQELEVGAESCSHVSLQDHRVLQFMISACKPVAKEISSFIRKNSGFENYSFLS